MNQKEIEILKIMNQATNRMDLNMFAQKVNLNPNQTIQQVQELAKKGLLRKVGSGYGVTEKGKAALKAFTALPNGLEFNFYIQLAQPTGQTAQTLADFYEIIKQVNAASLEFHLYRGDFEVWIKDALNDPELAKQIGDLKAEGLKDEDLRKKLLKLLDAKYSIE